MILDIRERRIGEFMVLEKYICEPEIKEDQDGKHYFDFPIAKEGRWEIFSVAPLDRFGDDALLWRTRAIQALFKRGEINEKNYIQLL